MKLRVQHGLTLIELMIVVAIIAILASVGYPAYQNYVLKAHRTDARAALMEAAEFLERNFAVNGSYTGNGVNFASIQAAALNKYNLANFYAVTAPTLTATTYLLQAASTHTPADTCGTLTINQIGVKTAAAQPGCAW